MKVEFFLWLSIVKSLLDFIHLVMRLFIAPWIRERKIRGLIFTGTKHMLEPQNELIIVVDNVINFGENSSPLFTCRWYNSEHRLQTLAIQLGLIVKVLKSEGKLLTLRHTLHTKVEPSFITIVLVGSSVMTHP